MDQHDEEEFRQYAAARMDDLRGLAYLTGGSWDSAEDAVSTALTKLYVNWTKVTNPHRYACRVVVNAVVDEFRRPWRRERSTTMAALDQPVADPADAYGEQQRVRAALAQVPAGQRAVLVLRFFEDFSVDEVAEILHKSPGTIKSQTARGLATLRRFVDIEEGWSDERAAPVAGNR